MQTKKVALLARRKEMTQGTFTCVTTLKGVEVDEIGDSKVDISTLFTHKR